MLFRSAFAARRDGKLSETDRSVDLTVDARQMRIMDKDVSEKDRAEIQGNMLGPKVLDTAHFPEIRFRSTAIAAAGDDRWTVSGDLTLHGQTHPVNLGVHLQNGHYQGSAQLKQKDFGIEPFGVGGGAVKVKEWQDRDRCCSYLSFHLFRGGQRQIGRAHV